jgi:hypothetical protein
MALDASLYRILKAGVISEPMDNDDGTIYFKEGYEQIKLAYFKKFNALHKWAINSCVYLEEDSEEDNCVPLYLTIEKLKQLKDICNRVLADHSLAKDEFPTCNEFLFDSQEYDKYYFSDVLNLYNNLIIIINHHEQLDNPDDWQYFYYAWY